MSVKPGFGGQTFIPTSIDKSGVYGGHSRSDAATRIEIDGGIVADNILDIVEAGVEIVVAGSAVFGKGTAEKPSRADRKGHGLGLIEVFYARYTE